jgi:hypothetical protein
MCLSHDLITSSSSTPPSSFPLMLHSGRCAAVGGGLAHEKLQVGAHRPLRPQRASEDMATGMGSVKFPRFVGSEICGVGGARGMGELRRWRGVWGSESSGLR